MLATFFNSLLLMFNKHFSCRRNTTHMLWFQLVIMFYYRSNHCSALPAKRLWHSLVKLDFLKEVFIRYIFKKRRPQHAEVSGVKSVLNLIHNLTHWGQNKMVLILQMTSAFSWYKISVFWFKFDWSLFLRVHLTICQHRFGEWFGANALRLPQS